MGLPLEVELPTCCARCSRTSRLRAQTLSLSWWYRPADAFVARFFPARSKKRVRLAYHLCKACWWRSNAANSVPLLLLISPFLNDMMPHHAQSALPWVIVSQLLASVAYLRFVSGRVVSIRNVDDRFIYVRGLHPEVVELALSKPADQ